MNAFITLPSGPFDGSLRYRLRCLGCPLGLFQHAAHGVAGLRAFADPKLRALQVHREIVLGFFRVVRADILDEPPVARAATVRHNNTIHRYVLRSNPPQSDSYWHNSLPGQPHTG